MYSIRLLIRFLFSALLIVTLSSCYFLKSTKAPIPYQASINQSKLNNHLFIFLPGLGDEPSAFEEAQFFANDLSEQKGFDYLLVDSHLGYYTSRQISQRIKQDILDPMSKRYQKITLVGTSLGGFGAILLADDYPEIINQAIVIAPYLGNREAAKVVHDAGGLAKWYQQGAQFDPEMDDLEQTLMAWKRAYRLIYQHNTKLVLTFGEQDGMAVEANVLAADLAKENVVTMPGGHKWKVWKQLWDKIINDQLVDF